MNANCAEPARVASEWLEALSRWIESNGLRGFDPFDVKQHPFIRAVQTRKWPRRLSSVACDLFPFTVRRVLHIEPSENPKAFALAALGNLRRYQVTTEDAYLGRAAKCLAWLREHALAGYGGLFWGYPFDVKGRGVEIPKGTPVGVVCAIAGEAFILAHELTQEAAYAMAARSIADFFLIDMPRLPQSDGSVCFAYTPNDMRRVHNANLYAAAFLYRVAKLTRDRQYCEAAEPALSFSLSRQRADGSWPYGEWEEGEPFEKDLMSVVDHHHTGFVLRSLHATHSLAPSPPIRSALDRGFRFYRESLLLPDGMPVTRSARYPVDIHACAEAVLCLSVLSDLYPEARDLASASLEWTASHMRDAKSLLPYYRRYPFFTSRIAYPRWGVAWMFYALSEYLARPLDA